MHRQKLVLIAVAIVSLLLGLTGYQLLSPEQPGRQTVSIPKSLETIPLTGMDGSRSLIGDRPEKFLIVNFWAPWCAPCRQEIPALIDIQRTLSDQGVAVLGIAFDGKQSVEEFADEYQINFPLFLAGAQISMYNAVFGNTSTGLPFTAILDEKRQRIFHHSGEITRKDLLKALSAAGLETIQSP